MSFLARFVPARLRACVGACAAHRIATAENRRLRTGERCELTPLHLAGARLVPDRRALLEVFPKEGVGAELGVAEGDFSAQLLDVCRPRKLYLGDAWQSAEHAYGARAWEGVRRRFAPEIASGRAEVRRGLSWDVLAGLPPDSLDWVYIDAAHDFDSVRRDLEAAESRVKRGGFIAGHDYTTWSMPGPQRFGVVEAVNAFCVRRNWRLVCLSHESDRHCSYALARLGPAA
jgi:hypothetical protein